MVYTFEFGGVPVSVSITVLFLVLILWVFSVEYIRKHYPGQSLWNYRLVSVIALVSSFASLVLHELAHAYVASRMGVPVVGAGVHGLGAYVQIDPNVSYGALAELLIVAAGPLTNILIGSVLAIYVKIAKESLFENTVQAIAYINISLGLLNFLPVYGLDGSKVLHAIVWGIANKDIANWGILVATIVTLFYFLLIRKAPKDGEGFIYRFFKHL